MDNRSIMWKKMLTKFQKVYMLDNYQRAYAQDIYQSHRCVCYDKCVAKLVKSEMMD